MSRSASSMAGMPSAAVGPKRASTIGETTTASSSPPGAAIEAPVSTTGTERASRALRSQPPERICSSCWRAAGSVTQASTPGCRGESRTKLARPANLRWGVNAVSARSPLPRSISTPSLRPRM